MKKTLLSGVLASVMAMTLLAGCGGIQVKYQWYDRGHN